MVINDTDELEKPTSSAIIQAEGITCFAHLPITLEGEPVGVLSAFSRSGKGVFTAEFIALLENIAGQVGIAWRNEQQIARLLLVREQEREMQIAKDIQMALLPASLPALEEIQVAGLCVPAHQVGSFALTGHGNSFVSDLVTVDFGLNFLSNSVYFGTVSGDFDDWGGRLYRLVTEKRGVSGAQEPSLPHEWPDLLQNPSLGLELDNPTPLIDVGQPVTAAPAVSWDYNNYWVYFGTGRLYNRNDYNDLNIFTYYGIKEPWDCTGNSFTWATVENKDPDGETEQGERGLLRVDEIKVLAHQRADLAVLECLDETTDCLPPGVTVFSELREYIAGLGCTTNDPAQRGTDGWKREFHREGERNLGQATLLGGLLTYSAYLPSEDICTPEGTSDLYALYFQTGTAWHRPIFKRELVEGEEVDYQKLIGPGLAVSPSLHVGTDTGAKAFLQTSTGAIISLEQPELPFSDYRTGREWWREIYRHILTD